MKRSFDAAYARLCAIHGVDAVETMFNIMINPRADLATRGRMAVALASFSYPKRRSVEVDQRGPVKVVIVDATTPAAVVELPKRPSAH